MVFILLGFGLFVAAIIAFILQDILSLWFCVLFGFFCLSMGMKKIRQPKQPDQTVHINTPEQNVPPNATDQTVTPPPISEPVVPNIDQSHQEVEPPPVQVLIKEPETPKRKISYHKTVKVAGVRFDCKYPNGFYNRQDVIQASKYSDKLILEEYVYNGSPAFLIINERLGADIGNVPAWAVDKIKQMSEKYDFEGEFDNIDFFEKEGRYTEYIYFCKVRLNGYKKQQDKKKQKKRVVPDKPAF